MFTREVAKSIPVDTERFEPLLGCLDDDLFHEVERPRLALGGFALILLTICVFAYGAARNGMFWLDQPTLNSVESLFSLTRFWTTAPNGIYRPLSMTILWAEARGFGELPAPYHALGLLVHAVSCLMVWLVLRRLAIPGAWLAAALFALHPVQVQSVSWISQQPHLIGAMFVLVAIWLGMRTLQVQPPLPEELEGMEPEDSPSAVGYVAALAACAAAVLSDPLGICLPLVLLLLIAWRRRPQRRLQWMRLAPFFAIALGGVVAGEVLRQPATELFSTAPALSAAQRLLVACRTIGIYAADFLRLHSWQFIQPRWNPAWDASNVLPVILVIATMFMAFAWRGRWRAIFILCSTLFVVLLLPGLATTLIDRAPAIYVADYQQYLAMVVPSAFSAIALTMMATRLSSSLPLRAARAVVGIVMIVLLGICAAIQCLTYRNADSAFTIALSHAPGNSVARAEYAKFLLDERPQLALNVLNEPGPAAGSDLTLLDARARVLLTLGDYNAAISNGLLAQRLAPDSARIWLVLADAYDAAGVAFMADGRRDEAFEWYDNALAAYEAARLLGATADLMEDGVGKVILHEGRLPESVDQFHAALALNPAFVPARVHLAQALFDQGIQGEPDKVNAALQELRAALRMDPTNAEAFCAAGDMQFRMKNFGASEKDYRSAIQYQPGSALTWTNLGFTQSAQNRFQEALRSFEKALWLRADAPGALRGKRLAQAQLATGNQKS